MSDLRLHAAALADRLIYGAAATFRADDATALLALMPAQGGRLRRIASLLPSLRLRGEMPSLGASGAAAGVGSVKMDGDTAKFDFDSHGRRCLRAGQWRLYRADSIVPGQCTITIEQVMATSADDERTAYLAFSHGRPTEMLLAQTRQITLGPLQFSVSIPRPWKTPAAMDQAA